ncbi:F0F1 ATP synthase subunit B [Succinimonas sp.]|uniref:F0F1 ATP synthase subunit B n=1 Tax=Succinimonas sp. TaxID=1936151 RepID=UPI0038630C4B
MSFNITFLIQMIAFLIFTFICMFWIWPLLMKAITDRQNEIKKSLDDAAKARQSVALAQDNAEKIISEAKDKAQEIVEQAENQRSKLIDSAQQEAKAEKSRIVKSAEADIQTAQNKAREELRKQIAQLATAGAEQILGQKLDSKSDEALINDALKNF